MAAAHAEALAGLCVAATVLAGATAVWGWYQEAVRPHARVEAVAPRRPRTVRADDAAAVRRLQRTTNLLGEANTYLVAGRYEWVRSTLARVLQLDPGNAEALVMLSQLSQVEAAAAGADPGAG